MFKDYGDVAEAHNDVQFLPKVHGPHSDLVVTPQELIVK